MSILKTQAVVLKGWKFGETSQILALYTRDHGKIKVMAKGGRGPKSKFKGCLQPLTHIEAVYYEKATRDLQLLSQCNCIDPHCRIVGDIQRTTLGLAAAELINRAIVGKETYPGVFDMLVEFLHSLNIQEGFLEGLFWYFEMRFIDLMGYKPTWDKCLSCGGTLNVHASYFQPENGGLLCRNCGGSGGGLAVDSETLEILYWLQNCGMEEAVKLEPSAGHKANIRKMFDLYFRSHIEHLKGLQSLAIFYQMEAAA